MTHFVLKNNFFEFDGSVMGYKLGARNFTNAFETSSTETQQKKKELNF